MKESEIDDAVRDLPRWKMVPCSGGCVAHMTDTNGPGYVHSEHVAILLRRVRDAEQERCAVKLEAMRNGHTIEVTSGVLIPDEDGPWFLKSDMAAAIRAPRPEEKR